MLQGHRFGGVVKVTVHHWVSIIAKSKHDKSTIALLVYEPEKWLVYFLERF